MIFLIDYDRLRGQVVRFEPFKDTERIEAETLRLDIELALQRQNLDREVVLLESTTEEALRRTHRRYFENARQIVESTERELK